MKWASHRNWTVMIMLVIGLVASACGDSAERGDTAGDNNDLRELTLGLPTGALTVHMTYVADTLGYYEEEGLDVELVPTEGSSAVAQQLIGGNFDVGWGGADVMMNAMEEGTDLYAFFPGERDYRDWIVPSDSAITSLSDLQATTVGVSNLSGGEVPIVRYLLDRAGLTDVELVAVGEEPAAIAVSFEQDRIQSYAGAQSAIVPFKLQTGFEDQSIYPDEFADQYVEFFMANESTAEDKELLVSIGRATAKGQLFCDTNPSACLDVIGKDHPELVEDPELATNILDAYLNLTRPPTREGRPYYGEVDRATWELLLEIFSSGREPLITAPEKIDLDKSLLTDLHEEINDFDHEAIIEQAENYSG